MLLLSSELFLDSWVEFSSHEDAFPAHFVAINEDSLTVHLIRVKLTLVRCLVPELHHPNAPHDAVVPGARVDVARGVEISPMAMHLIVFPITFVLFSTKLKVTHFWPWLRYLSISVFNFPPMQQTPVSLINLPIRVAEPSHTKLWHFHLLHFTIVCFYYLLLLRPIIIQYVCLFCSLFLHFW